MDKNNVLTFPEVREILRHTTEVDVCFNPTFEFFDLGINIGMIGPGGGASAREYGTREQADEWIQAIGLGPDNFPQAVGDFLSRHGYRDLEYWENPYLTLHAYIDVLHSGDLDAYSANLVSTIGEILREHGLPSDAVVSDAPLSQYASPPTKLNPRVVALYWGQMPAPFPTNGTLRDAVSTTVMNLARDRAPLPQLGLAPRDIAGTIPDAIVAAGATYIERLPRQLPPAVPRRPLPAIPSHPAPLQRRPGPATRAAGIEPPF